MVPSYLTGESTMKSQQRTIERLEPRHLMASDWQNASLIRDVDNSSLVTPLDALLATRRDTAFFRGGSCILALEFLLGMEFPLFL